MNENRYLQEIENLKLLLAKKYGAPQADDTYWSDDLYEDEPNKWGFAVGAGDLSKYVTWQVVLALSGENFETRLVVEYSSHAFEADEAELRESEILADL